METIDPIVEPNAQAHLGIGEDRGGDDRHVGHGCVPEQDREETLRDGEGDGRARLAAATAGAVVAPESDRGVAVHQREFELAGPIKIGAIRRDQALVADQLWDLGLRLEQVEPEQNRQTGREVFFHEILTRYERRTIRRLPVVNLDDYRNRSQKSRSESLRCNHDGDLERPLCPDSKTGGRTTRQNAECRN